eukprot:TRINITY_DN25_c4_g1_i3.p1 TRINITY_DN25_c4_g1~~TRINITY_DN25_c4_g1_i3.p1  ORF type:complete len:212 (-),score=58.29 TRINITY_DN25_c4_g1_i3:50-685(-)
MPSKRKNIGIEELRPFFHLKINNVAREFGVCATVLKKICRKNGIPRWPHRKLKSIQKLITNLENTKPKNLLDKERIQQEIKSLNVKREFIVQNPAVLALPKNGNNYQMPSILTKNAKTLTNNNNNVNESNQNDEEEEEELVNIKIRKRRNTRKSLRRKIKKNNNNHYNQINDEKKKEKTMSRVVQILNCVTKCYDNSLIFQIPKPIIIYPE